MKPASILLVGFTALGVFLLPSRTSTNVETQTPRTITVSGEAEIRVVPDEVQITLGVETWSERLDSAKHENDSRVEAVIDTAKDFGVEPQHIQTDHISIEPTYESYSYTSMRIVTGYFVRRTIVVTLRDISVFDDLLSEVVESGANYVHGIQFRTTELRKHRDDARELAINAAREKAVALAGELDQSIGLPNNIREDQVGWWSWYSSGWWGARYGGTMSQNVIQESTQVSTMSDDGMAPGQISVTARVTVVFELN
ncbi:MAG: SIMPL domain-containing protein [Anaerolineales bacterium]|jgi:uncharacterized protein YggE